MQVTEVSSQGLQRSYRVVFPLEGVADKVNAQLDDLRTKVQLKGFRKGKAPIAHLRRLYGRSVMGEVIQETVNEASRKIVDEHHIKLAQEPRVKFPEDKTLVDAMAQGKADLDFSVDVEVLPEIPQTDLSGISLVREMTPIDDSMIDQAVQRLAEQNRSFTPADASHKAEDGDQLTVDFTGTIDGQPFEGGNGEDIKVVLGQNSFIPGFEQGLAGVTASEERKVEAEFPGAYLRADLAGKKAIFQVKVKEVARPNSVAIDDELAKGFNMENLEALRASVKRTLERDFAAASRQRLKRKLLDALAEKYSFELPPSMVEQEFANIWGQVENETKMSGKSFADDDTTEEAARADYRKIAERRVRLGLVLADIGQKANITVADEEITQALVERARQFPGQEREVWDFYKKNQRALAELRAPIFEEKTVDHLLAQANIEERIVSREELFADVEEGDDASPSVT
ncbi:MAG: trigger factor [Hyphomicrobiales bacterium]|nr:trigger factor [Hyphomicrobiales bacterium]MBV9520558.1 trigger factor [Hyphomicrobiales bacterium]